MKARSSRHIAATGRAGNAETSALADRLRRFDLFTRLSDDVLTELAAATRVLEYRPGEALWHQGEANHLVLFIERGLAATSKRTCEGVDRTYGLYGPGDSMGIYAIWAGMRYPTDARVLNNCLTALGLETDVLVRCADREPGLAEPLMVEIGRFTEAFIRKIDIVSAGSVARSMATLLSVLIERHGIATGDNAACLPYKLTLAQIGSIADARVETVARVFSAWKKQGWLAIDAEGFHVLELNRLDALIGE